MEFLDCFERKKQKKKKKNYTSENNCSESFFDSQLQQNKNERTRERLTDLSFVRKFLIIANFVNENLN